MNWGAIWAIVQKDLLVLRRSKGVLIPLMIVPLVICIALPGLMASLPRLAGMMGQAEMQDMDELLAQVSEGLAAQLRPYTAEQQLIVLLVVYFLAPLFLILPLMVASVIAADSVAGEKERKTLEAILYTPTTDSELFLAKVIAACVPAILVAWGGFVAYAITVNWAAWPVMERIFFPNWMWVVLVVWVAPAVAVLGLSFTVAVSARVNSYQEAYQIGGVIVVPIIALVISQVTGVLYLNVWFLFVLGVGFWLVNGFLLYVGRRAFSRSRLAARL